MRDAVLELPAHVARVPPSALLAVDAHHHLEAVRIADLVGGHQARSHRVGVVEVLALARAELPGHFSGLLVARREIVEDGVAEDVLVRPVPRDVLARHADIAAELQLVVERLAVRGPGHLGIRATHREAVGMVEERPLVPGLGRFLADRLEGLQQMLLEAQEIAHLRRAGNRREQPQVCAVIRRGLAGAAHELIGDVERRGARLHDRQHAFQQRRAAVVHPRVGGLQVEDLAIAFEQRARPGQGVSRRESDESHRRF